MSEVPKLEQLLKSTETFGECFIWTGPHRKDLPYTPVPNGKKKVPYLSVRALIIGELFPGVPRHARPYMSCRQLDCINPKHFQFPKYEKQEEETPEVEFDADLFPVRLSADQVVSYAMQNQPPLVQAWGMAA